MTFYVIRHSKKLFCCHFVSNASTLLSNVASLNVKQPFSVNHHPKPSYNNPHKYAKSTQNHHISYRPNAKPSPCKTCTVELYAAAALQEVAALHCITKKDIPRPMPCSRSNAWNKEQSLKSASSRHACKTAVDSSKGSAARLTGKGVVAKASGKGAATKERLQRSVANGSCKGG